MKISRLSYLFVLIVLSFSSANCQISSDYLKQTMDSLFFQENGENRPGYSATIIRENEVIYQRSIGQINVEKKIPFDENSVFAIASCSKQFTAFGILLLEQEGKLKLTDDIRTYIPELPEFEKPILIKHLLSHTSGIRDHITMLGWENDQNIHFYDFFGTIHCLDNFNCTSFDPGEDFAYTNTGYLLLAFIAERASGMWFHDFMKESIFDPLKMNNTEFSPKRKYREYGFSRPYDYNWKSQKFRTVWFSETNAIGAVGIYTTMNDYAKWDQNFTAMTVGNEALFEKFLQSDTLNNGMKINYNNGLKERMFRGFHVVEHSGGWANYNFQHTRIPELNVSIIIASNNEFDYPIGMAETFLKEIIPTNRMETIEVKSTAAHQELVGTYRSDDFTTRTIEIRDSRAFISGKGLYGAKEFELFSISENIFADSTGNRLIFDSKKNSFHWSGGGYFDAPKNFQKIEPASNDPQKMEGTFSSDELGEIKFKYNKKTQSIRIKASFGKNPKIKEINGNRIDLSNVDYSVIIQDENTLILGNSWVYNVFFHRETENSN